MEDNSSVEDQALLRSASDYAYYSGIHNDVTTKDFLDRFPIPLIINALQARASVPDMENTLVACLERIFRTKYGISLIPQYMFLVQDGLKADSEAVRCLVCKIVSSCLENFDDTSFPALKLMSEYGVYSLLLDCLIDGDEQVASASMNAIKSLTSFPEGMEIIFPANNDDPTHLGNLAFRCTSLGRVRILALIVKLFSTSSVVASKVYHSNLLSLFESEVKNASDMLVALNVLELIYQLAEIQHGTVFLPRSDFLELLSSIISNMSNESILRSRAMMICGRLLSKNDFFMLVDESSVKNAILSIDKRLGLLESQDWDEYEIAIEALGQIGTATIGANLLLTSSPPSARYVIQAAFDQHGRGRQLAALHALGSIVGETRSDDGILLNPDAEESLRSLIYETASKGLKLTPSGLFLSVLQHSSEIRLAGYGIITGLVARTWCLMEICSKRDIISIVINAQVETTKIGMEARYKCCKSILKSLTSSSKLMVDPSFSEISAKLKEAVLKGPYRTKKHTEARPEVGTADIF